MALFLIALDCRPCITIVHDELYVLHQESKTRAAEHSNRLGTASMIIEILVLFEPTELDSAKAVTWNKLFLFIPAP